MPGSPACATPVGAAVPEDAPHGPLDLDAALVARARAGDRTAFEALVVRHQRRVAATIRALVRHPGVVEELAQEVFLQVHQHLDDFRHDGVFAAWLQRIARNTAASWLRTGQHRLDQSSAASAGDDEDAPVAEPGDGTHFAAAAEDEAASRQLFEIIDRTLAGLPAAQRDALILREVEGLDYRAIAATLGVPLNTARSHLFRAREAIAAAIRPLLAPTRSRRW